ncbi:MAG: SDR family oxidoreductase [Mariniblastus sp.]|nr:SDR family oxidoreductase [Mariniblastus sp.]
MFDFSGKTAVITGAGGAIGGEIARGLAEAGAGVAIWDIAPEAARRKADEISTATGGEVLPVECNVVSKPGVKEAFEKTVAHFGTIDMLINGAGGGQKSTTTSNELEFFDIDPDQTRAGIDLNYLSAVIPSQAVGRLFAEKEAGAIVNITSVGGGLPLSRALAYSNGKAAADSFTRWLAVHMATTYSSKIRVNAVAPGFIITDQNRFLLVDQETGNLTERGETILKNVPAGRFAEPGEIVGGVLWLLSEQATFVNGAIIPIDGGFSAFDGV